MAGSKKRRVTTSRSKGTKLHKQGVRKKFLARHIDQVWEDVRQPEGVHSTTHGPLGTTSKVELDEDIPALGKYYCTPCSRYFVNAGAMAAHDATKLHKKRCKELDGPRPHNQGDAEWAAGMGAADNGSTGFGMSLE